MTRRLYSLVAVRSSVWLLLISLVLIPTTTYSFLLVAPITKKHHQPGHQLYATNDESRGAALLMEQVSVYRGSQAILQNIDWRVEPSTKWAVVGQNGAGKSTLLRAIYGSIESNQNDDDDETSVEGHVGVGAAGKKNVGYLQQTAVAGTTRSVFDEASQGMKDFQRVQTAMQTAEEEQDWVALEKATQQFTAMDGYKMQAKVASVLTGLGFSDFDMPCNQLSGGWQMRVAFARLLLSEPSLCLMDEPGNHLDSAAKKWLARYLADYRGDGSMILVTHDVELLSSMDHIAEVIPGAGKLQVYKSCNYQQYLQLKKERSAAAVAEYERNQEKSAKLQAFVDRFGASATKASAAQSRVKQLEKMEREGLLDAPTDAIVAERFKPSLTLPDPPKAIGELLIGLSNADFGFGDKTLLSNVDLSVTKGMKLLIRGPNGAGKSTVLHALRGSLSLLSGERTTNPSLCIGMFTQDLAQELDSTVRGVDIVTAHARDGPDGNLLVSEQDARNVMGRLGLQGEKALRRLGDLSGGEKARVALAMFALKASNVYLLDEASNHLDTECVDALREALSTWGDEEGAVVVVSHDETFCRDIPFTHVATVANGSLRLEERSVRESDWVVDSIGVAANERQAAHGSQATQSAEKQTDPAMRKKAYNARKQVPKLERQIEKAELAIAKLDEEMLACGNDVGKLVEMSKEKESLEADVAEYLEEWEQLEGLLSMVAA